MGTSFEENLNKQLWNQRENGQCVDITISTVDGQVHAHRALLAMRSKAFEELLKNLANEDLITVLAKEFTEQEVLDSLKCLYQSTREFPATSFGFLRCIEHEWVRPIKQELSPTISGVKSVIELGEEEKSLTEIEEYANNEKLKAEIDTPVVKLSAIKGRKRLSEGKPPPSVAKKIRSSPRKRRIRDHKLEGDFLVEDITKDPHGLEEPSLACDCCNRTFLSKKTLRKHLRYREKARKKKDEEWATKCCFCKREYESKEAKENHEKTCMKQRCVNAQYKGEVDPRDPQGDAFNCLYCEDVLKSVLLLKNHVKLEHFKHTKGVGFHCLICDKPLTRQYCSNHVLVHIDRQYYRHHCEECDLRFATSNRLIEHKRSAHTFDLALKCKYCDKKFIRSSTRADHHKVCSKNPNRSSFQCNYCEKTFKGSTGKSMHHRICAKNPAARSQRPLKTVDKKPLIKEKCTFCEITSESSEKLDVHECKSNPSGFHSFALPVAKTKDYQDNVGGNVNDQILELLGRKTQ